VRVLLVDDEQDVRVLLRYWIDDRCDDVIIEEASNGLEAVDMVKEDAPDVVVMDLRMPVMGGLEATRQIKEVAPEADVVVYSATTVSDLSVIKAAGATDQFDKGDIEGLCRYLCDEQDKSPRPRRAEGSTDLPKRLRRSRE
jgi:two-component system invasion response regulator UvrY